MFLRRNDGLIGYALAEDSRYTLIADWAIDMNGVYRRVYLPCYSGEPIDGAKVRGDLMGARAELLASYAHDVMRTGGRNRGSEAQLRLAKSESEIRRAYPRPQGAGETEGGAQLRLAKSESEIRRAYPRPKGAGE